MRLVRPRPIAVVLAVYAVGGGAIGLAVPAIKSAVQQHLGRAGWGVAIVINVLMPFLMVTLAAAYPRMRVVLAGVPLATLAFLLAVWRTIPMSSAGGVIGVVKRADPILVVACIAYLVLAAVTVLMVRPWRRVGIPPDPRRCTGCGYLLVGLPMPRCPECFRAFDPDQLKGCEESSA